MRRWSEPSSVGITEPVAETVVGAPDGVAVPDGAVAVGAALDADGDAEGDGEEDALALRAGAGFATGADAVDDSAPDADSDAASEGTSGTLARVSSGNARSRAGVS
jgi:hypothetical protein